MATEQALEGVAAVTAAEPSPQDEAPSSEASAASPSGAATEPPSSEASAASPAGAAAEPASLPDLPLFSCKEAYVYRVPPATTAGHRAELWDVNRWLATVALRVVQADDDAFIRLLDDKTGELFAECPVPTDKALLTAVEPVVDSSRYYVLRIVDRESQRHAFIGIGFRERSEASDFNAALHEFMQYIKRKRTAEAMRHAYEERLQAAASDGSAQSSGELAPTADYSLKEGESLTLRIVAPRRAGSGGFVSKKRGLFKQFSLVMGEHGGAVAALSPPPARSPRVPDMCVSPAFEAGGGSPMHSSSESGGEGGGSGGGLFSPALPRLSGAGDAELQQRLLGLRLRQGSGEVGPLSAGTSVASGSPAAVASAAATDDDDFGEFEAA